MARDRLAALRAQRQQQGGLSPTSPSQHEMSNLGTPHSIAQSVGNGNGADPMASFYNEIAEIQDTITTFNGNVTRISEFQSRSLDSAGGIDGSSQHNAALLDELISQTRDMGTQIKSRIQTLEAQPAKAGEDQRMRKNRIAFARQKFIESLQNYQTVERDYRAKYKQRIERQFKIVKPDATPQQIDAVVNDTTGGGDQIFAQALTSSTRYGESRAAYREVQDRHEDIKRIERTLEELAQLFSDMSVLVAQQDDAINTIETTAMKVADDTGAGLQQTEKAVEHARSARRKRWYCFFLFLLILAILAIVLGVVFGTKK